MGLKRFSDYNKNNPRIKKLSYMLVREYAVNMAR